MRQREHLTVPIRVEDRDYQITFYRSGTVKVLTDGRVLIGDPRQVIGRLPLAAQLAISIEVERVAS